MKCNRLEIPVLITLSLTSYLILPVVFPTVIQSVRAQRPEPRPEYIQQDYEIPPERVELENGGYKLVYKNSDGVIWQEEVYALGVLVSREVIQFVYPSGQVAETIVWRFGLGRKDLEEITYDSRGTPERKTTTSFYQDGYNSIEEIWNNRRQRWESVPESERTYRLTTGNKSATTGGGGLQTTTFETPHGKIGVNLPDDIAEGDTVSGTIHVKPDGKTAKEKARNFSKLSGYVIEIEDQKTETKTENDSETFNPFKMPVNVRGVVALKLQDERGNEAARTGVFVSPIPPETEPEYKLPELGQEGRNVQIIGGFDGDSSNTGLKIGGEDAQILAESPRKMVAYNSSSKHGLTEIEVEEKGKTTKGEFRNIGIQLSAPKLDLIKGEQTTLTVKVLGLEGIKKPVPLVVENKSPSVISMGGGNLQRISISPNDVQGGIYRTNRPLTGITRGSFIITGTVVVEYPAESSTIESDFKP